MEEAGPHQRSTEVSSVTYFSLLPASDPLIIHTAYMLAHSQAPFWSEMTSFLGEEAWTQLTEYFAPGSAPDRQNGLGLQQV